MIGAVLWDMDGTLVDSEEYHWQAWREAMAAEGVSITRAQFLATFGQRNDAIIPKWLGVEATPEPVTRVGDAKGGSLSPSGPGARCLAVARGGGVGAAARRRRLAAGGRVVGSASQR